MPSSGLSAAEGTRGGKRAKPRDPGGVMGRERAEWGKAGGRGRSPGEVNDLSANLTLSPPALLKAEEGHLKEKCPSERPPQA